MIDSNLPFAQVAEEKSTLGTVTDTTTYLYGIERIQMTRAGQGTYYHDDGLGSTRALTDATGNLTDSYDYDDYGALQSQTGTTKNDFLFAGEQFDVEAGLYYNRARHLDTGTGRFTGLDPFEGDLDVPNSLHRYTYAANDPINITDPSGLVTLGEQNASMGVDSALRQAQNASSWTLRTLGKREWMLWDVKYNEFKHRFIWARKLGAGSTEAYGYHVFADSRAMARSRSQQTYVNGFFIVMKQPQVNHAAGKTWTVLNTWPVTLLTKKQFMLWNALAAGTYVGQCTEIPYTKVPYKYNIPNRDCTQWTEQAGWLARWASLIPM